MADGNMLMDTAEAREKALEMKQIATNMQTLLDDVSKKINEINSTDTGTYQGSSKAVQLRGELDSFRSLFGSVYNQIIKSADDITVIANTLEKQ